MRPFESVILRGQFKHIAETPNFAFKSSLRSVEEGFFHPAAPRATYKEFQLFRFHCTLSCIYISISLLFPTRSQNSKNTIPIHVYVRTYSYVYDSKMLYSQVKA